MKEQYIQKRIADYIEYELGGYARIIVTANKAGTPDILACIKGKFVAIETKMPGEEPTELQKWNMKNIIGAGGIAIKATSVKDFIAKYYK